MQETVLLMPMKAPWSRGRNYSQSSIVSRANALAHGAAPVLHHELPYLQVMSKCWVCPEVTANALATQELALNFQKLSLH